MNNTQQLGTLPVSKLLLKYSIPAIIAMMVNGLYNIVDRIFIGNIPDIGASAITGVGLTMPLMTVGLAFAMLIGIGSVARISISLGQGDKDAAKRYVGNSITMNIIVGIVLTVLMVAFLEPLLSMFGGKGETLVHAKAYITPILLVTTANMISFAMSHTVRADGSPRLSAMIMIIGCVLNIGLDALFIVVFEWGVAGAAYATAIAQIISAAWGLGYFLGGYSNIKLSKKDFVPSLETVKIICAIGMAPFSMQLASSFVQVLGNGVLLRFGGDEALAAMTIISSVALFLFMPIFGLNQGAQPIIGYNFGSKQYDRAQQALLYTMGVATAALFVVAIGLQWKAEWIVGFFTQDDSLITLASQGLRVYLLLLPVAAIAIVGPTYFQSVGKAKVAMFLSLLRQLIVLVPMFIILPLLWGLDGFWMAGPVADVISGTFVVWFLYREFKVQRTEKNIQQAA